jgi:HAD superfamily hydrolase (TIGR01458 family)
MPVDFKKARGILSDLDGVWFVGNQAVPGAERALQGIRARGLPVRFITNTTTQSLDDLAAKMHHLGFPVEPGEIINSPRAAALHLQSLGSPTCRLVVDDNVRGEFAAFQESDDTPDVVVIGDIGDRWSYDLMNEIFGLLIAGAKLVAMHRGRYWQTEAGLTLDIGAFVVGLEYAAGVEATVVGKPSPALFQSVLDDMKLKPHQVFMVGDDIHSDVGGAQRAGIPGVLVRTGKYREDMVARSDVHPEAIIDSVADLAELL